MKIKILILLLLSLVSCKTKQLTVETNTVADERVCENTNTQTASEKTTVETIEIATKTDLTEVVEQTVTTTKYSAPDSAGRQFVEELTIVETKSSTQENAELEQNETETIDSVVVCDLEVATQKTTQVKTESEIKEKTSPGWKKWIPIVIALVLGCVAWGFLK